MLEVSDLHKSYGEARALKGVSFSVGRGLCYGLLGPNGAGKTTAISIIAGTLEADSGEVLLDGARVGLNSLEAKRRTGYVPQDLALYEDLSASDNLLFFGALYDLRGADLEERMRYALGVVGLNERRKGPVNAFSGGMKRRLNIAASLMHDPDFIILDEPTVGVDPQSRNLIFEALEQLISEGKTLLYTTHYMEEAERLCKRIAIMDDGVILAEGDISDLHRILPARRNVQIQLESASSVKLDGVHGVLGLSQDGPTLTVELQDLTTDLPQALSEIRDRGGVVESVRTQRPSLEEVFLHLTGKSLRD